MLSATIDKPPSTVPCSVPAPTLFNHDSFVALGMTLPPKSVMSLSFTGSSPVTPPSDNRLRENAGEFMPSMAGFQATASEPVAAAV